MQAIHRAHDRVIHSRRVGVLVRHLAPLLPPGASVLDVGCGDGLLARRVADLRPDCQIDGIDVLVRPETEVPITAFDGEHIPYPNKSRDVVMFVDVLHHTEHPENLLREAKRVARQAVVLKDHTRDGVMAGATLRLMDWVGNAHVGVALPYNYLTRKEWHAAFGRLGLHVDGWQTRLGLYPAPFDLWFGRSLHFVARLKSSDAA